MKYNNKFYKRARNKLDYSTKDINILSRKEKKALLGKKINNSKLLKRISKVVINYQKYIHSAYKYSINISDVFCPICGCKETYHVNHNIGYPDIWEEEKCLRCNYIISYADNSPTIYYMEDVDINYWKSLGVTFIEPHDKQDDIEFSDEFI